jgi:hypothetical protein
MELDSHQWSEVRVWTLSSDPEKSFKRKVSFQLGQARISFSEAKSIDIDCRPGIEQSTAFVYTFFLL